MIRKLYGLVIIFLIVCTMPLSSYAKSNSDSFSMNDVFLNSLDVKVKDNNTFSLNDDFNNSSSNIILDHILDVDPDLTTGELNAIYTMMSEQFDSEFGNRKLKFYTMYLNNSTDYPVDGLPYTARELYDNPNNDYYKSWVNSVEQIINDYGHMSRQTRVNFLITKNPSMKNIMDVFDNADNTEKLYLAQWLENFTIPNYPTLATGDPAIDIGSINKYKDDIKTAAYNLGVEILKTDKTYRMEYMDLLPNINDGADFNESFNNDINKLNTEIGNVEQAQKNTEIAGHSCLITGVLSLLFSGQEIFPHKGRASILEKFFSCFSPDRASYLVRKIADECAINWNPTVVKIFHFNLWFSILLLFLFISGMVLVGIGIYCLYLSYKTLEDIHILLINLRDEMMRNKGDKLCLKL